MRLIAGLFTLLLFSPAYAADPLGSWRFDMEHFEAQMRAMMEAQMPSMPESMRPQMEQMMDQMMAEMTSEMAGTMTFSDDGNVQLVTDNGEQKSGTWEDQSDTIVITPDETGSAEFHATIEGDRLTMLWQEDNIPAPMSMVWIKQ